MVLRNSDLPINGTDAERNGGGLIPCSGIILDGALKILASPASNLSF
ncbi:hypothetical protein [Candidatus Nitrosocosmicus sp. SS]|jgi:hypothetical protein|nr:hypothetical protein [Candidatus Nitrosocosmicus sp. SS]MDR4490509.1 hypothetical protein [Candidatus Nitrosocosmicus sp.]